MKFYCPESKTLLEVMPTADSLDANAVVDQYENGVLTKRALATLSIAWNVGAPEPHQTATGLMFGEYTESSYFVESLIRKSSKAYRILELDTLQGWIVALDDNAKHTLLYQM